MVVRAMLVMVIIIVLIAQKMDLIVMLSIININNGIFMKNWYLYLIMMLLLASCSEQQVMEGTLVFTEVDRAEGHDCYSRRTRSCHCSIKLAGAMVQRI